MHETIQHDGSILMEENGRTAAALENEATQMHKTREPVCKSCLRSNGEQGCQLLWNCLPCIARLCESKNKKTGTCNEWGGSYCDDVGCADWSPMGCRRLADAESGTTVDTTTMTTRWCPPSTASSDFGHCIICKKYSKKAASCPCKAAY